MKIATTISNFDLSIISNVVSNKANNFSCK